MVMTDTNRSDFTGRQISPIARPQPAQPDRSMTQSNEQAHSQRELFAYTADNSVPSFGQHEHHLACAPPGLPNPISHDINAAAVYHDRLLQGAANMVRRPATNVHAIGPFHREPGMCETVSRLPVGGEKEKTCRRHIQSPHIRETRQVGHQIEYGGTTLCIAAGDDVPGGLMQRNPRRFDGPDPAASDRYGVGQRVYGAPQLCHDPIHAHSPGRDHFFSPAA